MPDIDKKAEVKKELLLRAKAKKDLKTFVLLKWARYEQKPFLDNWHYDYLCQILESTLPEHSALGHHCRDLAVLEGKNTSKTPFFQQKSQKEKGFISPVQRYTLHPNSFKLV